MSNDNIVFRRHPDYIAMEPIWRKMRVLLSGSEVVKQWDVCHTHGEPGIETFLLKPPGEEERQYNYFVYSARYSDFVSRTKQILEGLLFYRDPVLQLPAAMQPLLTNVDMSGMGIVEFAKHVAGEILTMNRGGIYVDYPVVKKPMTRAEAERKGYRSFLKFIPVEKIFDWEYTIIDNVRTITKVFIAEETDDDFTSGTWKLVRVLSLEPDGNGNWIYYNTLYEVQWTRELSLKRIVKSFLSFSELGGDKDSTSGYMGTEVQRMAPQQADGSYFNKIPFWFTSLVYNQFHMEKSPLNDVADANIAHYRICADIQSALFHCAHPTPIFCGFNFTKGQQVLLGDLQGISSTNEKANAKYLELTGKSISELRAERDSILKDLAALGARSLSSISANSQTTAETSQINASGDTAILNTLAGTMDSILTQALRVMAAWQGVDPTKVSVSMNREFMPFRLASNTIAVLLNSVLQKAMPVEDFVDILQTGGIIRQSTTIPDYLNRLKNPAVTLGKSAGTDAGGSDTIPQAGIGEGSTQA